jgi:hypothetical protein
MAAPDIHCQEGSGFDTVEVVGTDYVPAAAGSDTAAVGTVAALAVYQDRIVVQMQVGRGPQVD